MLTFGSVAFVIWDQATNTPSVPVMKLAWVLVMLYTGPIGLFVYLLSCRQPLPDSHDAYIAAHWKQTVGSMAHCLAGDATGIVLSAALVYHFALPNGIDLTLEYISAFLVGLFVFQALFMKSMFGNYWVAVRKTFFSETVSMNMVMVGMIPTMAILMHVTPEGDNPWNPAFWGVMSMATLMGGITAYPINSWLVRKGFKHGMMTAPSAKAGHGGAAQGGTAQGGTAQGGTAQGEMAPGEMAPGDMSHGAMAEGQGMQGHHHSMASPSPGLVVGLSLATFALMIAAGAIASLFVPIRF